MARTGWRWPLAALVGFAVGVACSFGIDPDRARFACAVDGDCGEGFECKPQLSGGGICYRAGQCTAEACDGQDNDCNGAVDDALSEVGTLCESGLLGVCAGGKQRCEDGTLRCVADQTASAERCDSLDNDCD